MYLQLGFERANREAPIEIRRGAMDREQAVGLARIAAGPPSGGVRRFTSTTKNCPQTKFAASSKLDEPDILRRRRNHRVPEFRVAWPATVLKQERLGAHQQALPGR